MICVHYREAKLVFFIIGGVLPFAITVSLTYWHKELGLAQHLRSLAAHQGAVLALHGASSRSKHVVGIVVVEPIRHADLLRSPTYAALPESPSSLKASQPLELPNEDASVPPRAATLVQTDHHATLMGVAVMWIHSEHRRKGLAQHLISIACTQPTGMFFQFIGCTNKQVAFLAPTDDGIRFASRLRGDGHLLQYSRYEEAWASGGRGFIVQVNKSWNSSNSFLLLKDSFYLMLENCGVSARCRKCIQDIKPGGELVLPLLSFDWTSQNSPHTWLLNMWCWGSRTNKKWMKSALF